MESKRGVISLNSGHFAETAFILYFANAAIREIAYSVIGKSSISTAAAVLLPYAFLMIACVMNPKKYVIKDFIVLFSFIILFFLVTLLIFPEYAEFYDRNEYGIWDHVLIPYRGLYAYLFVRTIKDPQKVIKDLKIAGVMLLPYFLFEMREANQRGYWMGVGRSGAVRMSYSVSFGYQILPFVLVFLYDALRNRRILDIVGAAVGLVLVLGGGSRGPVLFVGEIIAIYFILRIKNSRHKILLSILTVFLVGLIYFNFDSILIGISAVLTRFGLSSRFIKKMLAGTIADDSGRSVIWQAAWDMIRANPFGYGAMGSRHVITSYIYAGYPHSIILEMLVDYGVIIGSLLLIYIFFVSMKMILRVENDWKHVFVPMFCSACCLFISMTYWSIPAFWASIAIVINYRESIRRKRREVLNAVREV